MKKILMGVFAILMLSGCGNEPDTIAEELVVEGYIASDGEIRVYLTKTVSGSSEEGSLEDAIVRWGKVTVWCGDEQKVLIGRPSSLTIPPFVYSSYLPNVEPGKVYHLEATYGAAVATATCTMPPAPPEYKIESRRAEVAGDGRVVEIEFEAPADTPAYFMAMVTDEAHKGRMFPSMGGVVECREPVKRVRIPLYPPRSDFDIDDQPTYFDAGKEIYVELLRITRPVYDFWLAYDEAVSFSNGLFIGSLKSLPTNISCGLGVWSAQSTAGIKPFIP